MKQYMQCRLERSEDGRTFCTTGWIEARGAKLGARVELLPSGQLWTVVEVFKHGIGENVLKETQRLNRRSLPSVEAIA